MGFLRQSNTKVPRVKLGDVDGGLSGAGRGIACFDKKPALSKEKPLTCKSHSWIWFETQSEESANITQFDIGKDFLSVFGDGCIQSRLGTISVERTNGSN